MFEVFEQGKLTLDEYLSVVVFHKKRTFTRTQFRRFMFSQSKPHPKVIALFAQIKRKHRLKVIVVSNEARELNAYRIRTFKLAQHVDAFVSSCFVQMRKPGADIFRLALDIAQVPAERVLFVDNTALHVEIAEGLGIRGIVHTDYASTVASLASFGLEA